MVPEPDHGESSYRGSGRLVDRKAVITGGDSGIGRAVAVAFAREGADVLLSFLPEEQHDAEETAELVRQAGREVVLVVGDLRDESMCRRIVDSAVEQFGRIDVLVNNAAYQMSREGGLLGISTEQFDRVFKTNIYAMFWLCKAAIPATMPAKKVETFGGQTPLGRAAQPAELAPPYVVFASRESSYVTGEVLGVTGGQVLT